MADIYKYVSRDTEGWAGRNEKKKYKVTTEINIRRKKKREKVFKKLTNLHSR